MKNLKRIFFTGYAAITNVALLSLVHIVLIKQNSDFNQEDAMNSGFNIAVLCGLLIMCAVVAYFATRKAVQSYK